MTDTVSTKENNAEKPKGKFSLIDLLMIIMVVGVLATIVLPLQRTKSNEALVRGSLPDMIRIVQANDEFKRGDGFGDNAWDLDQLNLRNIDMSVFHFAINDTSIVATTNRLGSLEKAYYFDTRDNRFRVREDSRDVIFDTWLP